MDTKLLQKHIDAYVAHLKKNPKIHQEHLDERNERVALYQAWTNEKLTGQDTILRNLALLNVLWDGGEMAIDRRSKPSFVLRGRRLTFGLMVQPEALRGFLERAGTLPRGTGFIARFLIAWPGSTQGTRAYRPAPEAMLLVALFGGASGSYSNSRWRPTPMAASPRRCWICRRRHVPSGYAFTMRSRANSAREAHSAACAMLRPRRRRTWRGWPPCSTCWSMARAER
ncbi:MAG: DUF3987 domain-containing protein [Rhodocyclales bacterium]|nr:DUF3987 domain-containing protein [Rhodocyclales bacterium]